MSVQSLQVNPTWLKWTIFVCICYLRPFGCLHQKIISLCGVWAVAWLISMMMMMQGDPSIPPNKKRLNSLTSDAGTITFHSFKILHFFVLFFLVSHIQSSPWSGRKQSWGIFSHCLDVISALFDPRQARHIRAVTAHDLTQTLYMLLH